MAWLRCPRCSCAFRAEAKATQVCPACGWRGWTPPPTKAPEKSPHYRPPPQAPAGGRRSYLAFLALSLLTLLAYPFVYYWKVFADLDRQNGRRSPVAWYAVWVAMAFVLLLGAGVEALVWWYGTDINLAVHVALFGTAFAVFLLAGGMHIALGLARLRDYRRAQGLGRPIGGVTFAFLVAVGVAAGAATAYAILVALDEPLDDKMAFLWYGVGALGGLVFGTGIATAVVNAQANAVWDRIDAERPAFEPVPGQGLAEV